MRTSPWPTTAGRLTASASRPRHQVPLSWPGKTTHGRAVLRRGRREQVRLEEAEPAGRAPILRHYLAVVPGARLYLPVDRRAPLEEFERIAAEYPVFRIAATAGTGSDL
jgi:hypothetical protein